MNTLNYIFDETMRREGKRAALLFGGEEFTCFFRRNNDNQNTKDTMIMYYRADAPVYTGNLISFDRFSYLVLNKETAENDVYYKSAVIRCNGTINTHSLSAVGLPIFGATVNNAKAEQTTHYSLIDGNIARDFPIPARAVIHGDALSPSIAAASSQIAVSPMHACRCMLTPAFASPQYSR